MWGVRDRVPPPRRARRADPPPGLGCHASYCTHRHRFPRPDRGDALAKAAEEIFAQVDTVLATVPADQRRKVYLARGAEGLESGSRGSITTEIIERVGAVNVVEGLRDKGGLVTASAEQVIA